MKDINIIDGFDSDEDREYGQNYTERDKLRTTNFQQNYNEDCYDID